MNTKKNPSKKVQTNYLTAFVMSIFFSPAFLIIFYPSISNATENKINSIWDGNTIPENTKQFNCEIMHEVIVDILKPEGTPVLLTINEIILKNSERIVGKGIVVAKTGTIFENKIEIVPDKISGILYDIKGSKGLELNEVELNKKLINNLKDIIKDVVEDDEKKKIEQQLKELEDQKLYKIEKGVSCHIRFK